MRDKRAVLGAALLALASAACWNSNGKRTSDTGAPATDPIPTTTVPFASSTPTAPPAAGSSACDRPDAAAVLPTCFEGLPPPCILASTPAPACPAKTLVVVDDDTTTGEEGTWKQLWEGGPGQVDGCPSTAEQKFTFRDTIQHMVLDGELRHADWKDVRAGNVNRGQTPVADAIKRIQRLLDGALVDAALVTFDGMLDAPLDRSNPRTLAGDIKAAVVAVRAAGHGVFMATRPKCHRHALVIVRKGMTRARRDLAHAIVGRLSPGTNCPGYEIDLGPVVQDSLRVTATSSFGKAAPATCG